MHSRSVFFDVSQSYSSILQKSKLRRMKTNWTMTNITFAKVFMLDYDSFNADVTWERGMSIENDCTVHEGSTDVLDFSKEMNFTEPERSFLSIKMFRFILPWSSIVFHKWKEKRNSDKQYIYGLRLRPKNIFYRNCSKFTNWHTH